MSAIEFTTSQKFEIERMSRAIDGTSDVEVLKSLAKQLLNAWMVQKAATIWAIEQSHPRESSFGQRILDHASD
jgi:hypothetical protein